MADAKITQLIEDTSLLATDLIATVEDPSGTPVTKKATITNLSTLIKSIGMLNSKVIIATRDMTAASGDVAYTGVGFTPTSILFVGAVNATGVMNIGVIDSTGIDQGLASLSGNFYGDIATFIGLTVSGGNSQTAIVKTYDADGFTLTWTKTGSPTGTGNLIFLCFR